MDSNIFIKDFMLKSQSYKELHQNSHKFGIKLFASSIVIDEVVQKFKEFLYEFNKENKKYYGIVPDNYLKSISDSKIEKLTEKYRKNINDKMRSFNKYGTRFLNLDLISLEQVVKKAIRKIIPFRRTGKGFRDALIWEHIRWIVTTYCDENRKLAFITENVRDFCDLDNKNNEWFLPAKELRMDLIEEKYFRDTVKIYPSISSFNRNVIHRKIDHIEKIQNNKNINKYIINLVSIELDKFDVLEVYNNCQKEKSKFIKVYEAKVVEGYNYYGNSSDEVILLVQIELLCKSLNKSANYFKTITKAQIYSNIKTNNFSNNIEFERFIVDKYFKGDDIR